MFEGIPDANSINLWSRKGMRASNEAAIVILSPFISKLSGSQIFVSRYSIDERSSRCGFFSNHRRNARLESLSILALVLAESRLFFNCPLKTPNQFIQRSGAGCDRARAVILSFRILYGNLSSRGVINWSRMGAGRI